MMLYWIIPLIVLLDQATKVWATRAFLAHKAQEITPFFNLSLVHNTGVSFSLLNNLPYAWILIALTVGITAFLFYWQLKEKDLLTRIALLIVIGGSIGNIIDRIRLGAVIDFLDFHWKQYHWPAFNIADSAVCIGVALILFSLIKRKKT